MNINLISCENVSKSFGDKIIIENQSFGIHKFDKIGLLGINGSGKSTLLKLLAKKEIPDAGRIVYRNNIKISYLPQQPYLNPNLTLIEQLFQSNDKDFVLLRKYYSLLKNPEKNSSLSKIIDEIDRNNLWNIQSRAEEFLTKLGFNDFNKKISFLSGGEKRKLDIARVLMENGDILLLDEPTNHLDIKTIEWLQNYLSELKKTIVFVTHDRYFLDEISNKILEIEDAKLKFYFGNYSFYLKEKQLAEIDLKRKETRRISQLKRELKWLERGAKARTSKPKEHIKRVMNLLNSSFEKKEKNLEFSFVGKRQGKTILELINISKSYGERILIKNFTHYFTKGEKIGIIGDNGCGKTTLLKIVTGEILPDIGEVKVGINTKFSYFKQEDVGFKKDATLIDYIKETAEYIKDKRGNLFSASQMLERFLFDAKKQYSKISALSGGEKKRLQLLKSLMLGANFIIFDEPTNDFDIKTLSVLEDYLNQFEGNILVVSHDRYFLDRCIDYLFVFENGDIIKFPGNYSDYLSVKKYKDENTKKQKKEKPKKPQKTTVRLSYKDKRELEKIEESLERLEEEKNALNKKIEDKAAELNYKDFAEIQKRIDEITKEIEKLEERWLEINEKVE